MGGILDLICLDVASAMAGEDLGAVDDAHHVRFGQHGERAPDLGARLSRQALSGSAIRRGVSSAKATRTLRVCCSGQGRSAGAPGGSLGIEIVHICKLAGREKPSRAQRTGHSTPPFSLPPAAATGRGLVTTVRGECEQRRVEADGITLSLQHDALEICVPNNTRGRPCQAVKAPACPR